MSNLSFCIEQRKKEIDQTQKILTLGLVGSVVLHAVIALAVVGLYKEATIADEPIELIMVEESSATTEVPKPPKENLKEVPKPQPMKVTSSTPKTLAKTEESNAGGGGGGQQQPSASTPEQSENNLFSSTISKALSPRQVPRSLQPQQELQPKTPVAPTETPPSPAETSSRLPLKTTEEPKPVLNNPFQSDSTVAATNTAPTNPNNTDNTESTSTQSGSGESQNLQRGTVSGSSGEGGGSGTGTGGGIGSGNGQGTGNGTNPGSNSTNVATAPKPPKPPEIRKREGLRCISNCEPPYPSVLNGVEGSAAVQIVVNANGNVDSAILSKPHNNSQINQQVLLAARKMKFTAPPNGDRASVQINVKFTVAGSEFDRRARELREQQQRQRLAQEQERKARQAQQDRERRERERQAQLEQQRQEQQRQQQQQQQQQPKPETEVKSPEVTPPLEPLQPLPNETQKP